MRIVKRDRVDCVLEPAVRIGIILDKLQEAQARLIGWSRLPKIEILASHSPTTTKFCSKCIEQELRTLGRFLPSFRSPAAVVPQILSLYVLDLPPNRPQIRKPEHRTVKSIFPRSGRMEVGK